ncbi:MAG TPA: hypothetical protein VFB96_04295 [Pirellulaceae bacterium]|nr:hypothetical protein [Pirellulaceae bacterium]
MSAANENPYQAPATVDTRHDPAFPPEKRIRLFATPMVLLALVACTPLPALVMLAINCRRLGWRGAMWGFVAAAALALVTAVIPFAFNLPIPVLVALFFGQYLLVLGGSILIWQWIKRTRPRGSYRYSTYVSAFLTAFLAASPLVVVTIVGTILPFVARGTRVELAGGHECYISGDATEDDALFVGKHLLDEGYLDSEGGSTLYLNRAADGYTLSFVISPESASDKELRSTLRSAGEELADLRLGRPLAVRMVDDFNRQVYWRTTIKPKDDTAAEAPGT